MDGEKFDDLIRQFCTSRLTRWHALRGLVAGAAAAWTGATLVTDETDARKKRGKGGQGAHKDNKKGGKGGHGAHQDAKKGGKKKGKGGKGKSKKKNKNRGGQSGQSQVQDQGGGSVIALDEPCDLSNFVNCTGCNPTCPASEDTESISDINPGEGDGSQTVNIDGCECTVSWDFDGASSVTLTTDCTIGSVIVKGGANSAARTYTLDNCTGTIGPFTTATGQDISHISICGIGCCIPETCESLGAECGEPEDTCGGILDCGTCPDCPNYICTDEFQCICTPDTCASEGLECTSVPQDDGCCETFHCPCPTTCPDGGENNTCENGTCVCTKNTCDDVQVECGTGFNDGCCGEFDCNCPTNCEDTDDGPNNTCVDGTCVCTPDTCASEGLECTTDPVNDGCCGEFRCPCPTECPGGGANNTCEGGTCVCTPDTCEDLGVCGRGLDNGCCGTIDCDCPTTCPPETDFGPNTECVGGECVCDPDTCASEGLQCTTDPIDDGCCGEFRCPCPTECPGGGANNTCEGGICVCDKNTCADVQVECGTGFDDGCCGTFHCNCPTDCPPDTDDGPNNTCVDGTCVCTKNTCDELGCGVHDDGCCGEIDCGPCPEGCTPGFWKNHPEAWVGFTTGQSVGSVFTIPGCLSSCNLGGKTLLQALSFKGGSTLCGAAQILLRAAVAALLNAASTINYPLDPADVVADVNAALASCTRQTIIDEAARLDGLNNAGCPL